MDGVSGTSGTGKTYRYYKCLNSPKECRKKNVRKDYIEPLILDVCRELMSDDMIDSLVEEIEKQNLPVPHQDLLPETVEEQIICYADKFCSKTHLGEGARTIDRVRRSLAKFGPATVDRLQELIALFGVPLTP